MAGLPISARDGMLCFLKQAERVDLRVEIKLTWLVERRAHGITIAQNMEPLVGRLGQKNSAEFIGDCAGM